MKDERKELKSKLARLEKHENFSYEKKIWDGKVTKDINQEYKISLCTTCMGRLHDLKDTLPENIKFNKDYQNLEFVILDYNSPDGLEDWMKANMMPHIESGKVVYYKTVIPRHYSMTKSRNLAFKLASGDIVNNVDADNFVNEGFARYVNVLANQQPERAIFAKGKKMLRGRLGFWKSEFMEILKGYDEEIEHYGHDDHDLLERAWLAGFTLMWYGGKYYTSNGSKKHQTENMREKNWQLTELRNKIISAENIVNQRIEGNSGAWGQTIITKNFKEEFVLT